MAHPISRPKIYETPAINAEEQSALARIDDQRKQLKHYLAEQRRWVGPVRRVLAARAIQGTNSIEGYDVSVEDAMAAIEGDEPQEAEWENWAAVSNYRRAMTYVLQLARDPHFAYSATLLGSLHFMMTEYDLDSSPGLLRPGPIWVRNDATGDVVYEGPDPGAVAGLVDSLVEQLSAYSDIPPTIRSAMAHLNLVMIHPFRDGNGRMARCLQTLVLAREGILVPEFSSIEEYLGRNTQTYYSVLAEVGQGQWNPLHDARPWIRYCLEAHYVQAASVLRRIRESEQIWQHLEILVARARLPERAAEALFAATIGMRVRNSSYRASVAAAAVGDISNQTATTDLRQMVDAGLLTKHGVKRGTYYVAASDLTAFYRELREQRREIDPTGLFAPLAEPGSTLF